jgi:hypothetical protein
MITTVLEPQDSNGRPSDEHGMAAAAGELADGT